MKIISGGQTGVDRAALDVARSLGIDTGGWCPKGGRAEDNINLLEVYPELEETPEKKYKQRTRLNVKSADATIIFHRGNLSPGTALTLHLAKDSNKPWVLINLEKEDAEEKTRDFILTAQAQVLNIAGPRESSSPGVYDQVFALLSRVLVS